MDDFAHIVGEDVHFRGRSPSGERGLKFIPVQVRRADIQCRSPSGERGLKYFWRSHVTKKQPRRSPSGERGLKFRRGRATTIHGKVAPHPGSVD